MTHNKTHQGYDGYITLKLVGYFVLDCSNDND